MPTGLEQGILKDLSQTVAQMLLELSAVKINIREPFKLVSGEFSPIYVNCRQVISNASFMNMFTACARLICERRKIRADFIAGGETAGIPFAAFLAQSLALPMVYVRKEKKDHGLSSLVEGLLSPNSSVLLVEDLITDGESKLHFIDAVRASKGRVKDVLVLFDREQGGQSLLGQRGINLHAITTMSSVTQLLERAQFLSESDLSSLRLYLDSPHEWSAAYSK